MEFLAAPPMHRNLFHFFLSISLPHHLLFILSDLCSPSSPFSLLCFTVVYVNLKTFRGCHCCILKVRPITTTDLSKLSLLFISAFIWITVCVVLSLGHNPPDSGNTDSETLSVTSGKADFKGHYPFIFMMHCSQLFIGS